ncbi:hypothetical protein [Bradyrhizobium sp.]|uniref:hypothetical protein n=1 Tax=Bradyrhizobium sp. TaxID=376 RepID=UPI0039E282BE
MIQHDLTQWPLVLSVMRGVTTLDEQVGFFSEWNGWLDRGEPFITLRVFSDAASLERPEGGAKEAKAWLQANADRVKSLVMGMATIVPAESFEDVSRMNAEKLFGVPAKTFDDVSSAIAWVEDAILLPRGVSFDREAATRFLVGG